MPHIRCTTKIIEINGWLIARLTSEASIQLPSRGQVMVSGTLNDIEFQAALEPDGNSGHWLNLSEKLQKAAKLKVGDNVELNIEATKFWPEPEIPKDLTDALTSRPEIAALWENITPMARWEWIRWINSTANPETRTHRIDVSLSKLKNGLRRPCCFNRNMCCVPQISKNGVLIGTK